MQRLLHNQNKKVKKNKSATCVVLKTMLQKKNIRAFNVARQRQRSIYQITSPTTCNRQANELRLNSFSISTTLLSFKQLIHLDYSVYFSATWLVARWVLGGETPWWQDDRILWQGIETIKHIHIWFTSTSPLPENQKDGNREMWKWKDVKIVAADWNLTYKFCTGIVSGVLTLSKTRLASYADILWARHSPWRAQRMSA